jgi:hypothetical protein
MFKTANRIIGEVSAPSHGRRRNRRRGRWSSSESWSWSHNTDDGCR